MNDGKNDLTKSYKLLALWLILYVVIAVLFAILLVLIDVNISSKALTIFWFYFTSIFLISFHFMIYKTERIYYINYISYKEAREATSEERRDFAYRHLVIFCIATIIFITYSIFSFIFRLPTAMDIGAWAIIIIFSAIRTIPIKLKEKNTR